MGTEMEIVVISIVAMIGIIGMPTAVFLWFWRKSGEAQHDKLHSH